MSSVREFPNASSESTSDTIQGSAGASFARSLQRIASTQQIPTRVPPIPTKEYLRYYQSAKIRINIEAHGQSFSHDSIPMSMMMLCVFFYQCLMDVEDTSVGLVTMS